MTPPSSLPLSTSAGRRGLHGWNSSPSGGLVGSGSSRSRRYASAVAHPEDPMSDPVLVERDGAVVTLTLNRPDVRNAMTAELTEAFSDSVAALRGDPEMRALVVTGAGRAFCAGGDLSWINPGPGASVSDMRSKMRA